MVLAKEDKVEKDLLKEGIDAFYDTETGMIKADGTSLGGDDGIGVAIQLAVMHNKDIKHGPIEHLFTVNEEDQPGKCIIEDLPNNELKAKYYLNIDSETFNEITYGGAGCSTMKYECPLKTEDNKHKNAYSIALTGLHGGHSGTNISRPHINPIEFLAQCIHDFAHLNKFHFNISKYEGGPINNSLPTYAKADVIIEEKQFEKLKRFLINQLKIAKKVAQGLENEAELSFDRIEAPKKIFTIETSINILLFASLAPNKVFTSQAGSTDMYSSSNIGFISTEGDKLRVDFKIRSYLDGEIQRTVRKIESLGQLLGFNNYKQEGQLFSFINDLKQNELSKIYAKAYKEIVGEDIKFLAVPAGLECGIVCVKNPNMIANTISINTSLYNCHSPSESFSVSDTSKL
ncbi:MAG: M20/M25/M40 family metallo-hydrolase [Mycoplasmoidaceae bacterium]|nr:M20/M25/M40 family metallo-hydrolase [Mycoplasmoidaceae bacterium]